MFTQFAGWQFADLGQFAFVHVSVLDAFFKRSFLPLPAYTPLVSSMEASMPKNIFFIIVNLNFKKLLFKEVEIIQAGARNQGDNQEVKNYLTHLYFHSSMLKQVKPEMAVQE